MNVATAPEAQSELGPTRTQNHAVQCCTSCGDKYSNFRHRLNDNHQSRSMSSLRTMLKETGYSHKRDKVICTIIALLHGESITSVWRHGNEVREDDLLLTLREFLGAVSLRYVHSTICSMSSVAVCLENQTSKLPMTICT